MSARHDLVVDSSLVVRSCVAGHMSLPGNWRLRAPPLLWSEVLSTLHAAQWRGDLTREQAGEARAVFGALDIIRDDPARLADEAWSIADERGLAKTYDAEFLALARIRSCQFVTADARLYRAARELGFVVTPVELRGS